MPTINKRLKISTKKLFFKTGNSETEKYSILKFKIHRIGLTAEGGVDVQLRKKLSNLKTGGKNDLKSGQSLKAGGQYPTT